MEKKLHCSFCGTHLSATSILVASDPQGKRGKISYICEECIRVACVALVANLRKELKNEHPDVNQSEICKEIKDNRKG